MHKHTEMLFGIFHKILLFSVHVLGSNFSLADQMSDTQFRLSDICAIWPKWSNLGPAMSSICHQERVGNNTFNASNLVLLMGQENFGQVLVNQLLNQK